MLSSVSEGVMLSLFLVHLTKEVEFIIRMDIFAEPVHEPLIDIVGDQEGEDRTDHNDAEEGLIGA